MKDKIKITKKTKGKKPQVKWTTYTYKPKGKLAKQVKEHFQTEKDKKDRQHKDLRDIAIYLSGMLKGQGNISPLGTAQLDSLWQVILELR